MITTRVPIPMYMTCSFQSTLATVDLPVAAGWLNGCRWFRMANSRVTPVGQPKGGKMTEVVALFATRTDAHRAIETLEDRGYDASTVGYLDGYHDEGALDRDIDRELVVEGDTAEEAAKGAAGGAVGGAAVGAGAGLLAAAGMAVIPGIGPFLAAGTILGTLGATAAGAAGGAVLGGAVGAIFGSTDDEDDEYATYYRQGVEEGGSLVTVRTDDSSVADVRTILQSGGAKRIEVHGDAGWVR